MKKDDITIEMSRLARVKDALLVVDNDDVLEERLEVAKELIDELQNDPDFDIRFFRASVLEHAYGIYDDGKELKIDELQIEQNIMLEKIEKRDDIERIIFNKLDDFVNENLADDVRKAALELHFVYKDYFEVIEKRYFYTPGEKLPDDIWNIIVKSDKRLTEVWDIFTDEFDCILDDENVIRKW
ncbi:hypothetical protein COL30_11935 [Bacillus pseudomycoides]|uniref:hypothetical protein n=1 Tax=Bacillus pseudomycoides TaxID=64104 RepID=UPI000BEBDE21|nr:hypothetical protein [Bacillus pseudomycoides]PED73080.1 hypothetical protein CON97_05605 [Bacillus pseudomycoides]PFW79994.1 hypothetical protein COL30_11935 [Bacillus pseudomycoides]PFZ47043.1 hypothetical protein COL56_27175 [Bacillus pseudomycoides]PHE39241.1 hypothetical protein COF53_29545 [Bacillus pseudomycoides]